MTERETLSEQDIEKLVSFLKKFFGNDEEKTRKVILRELAKNPYVTSAEIFRKLSNGKGRGKPHGSTMREETLPSRTAPRTSRRRPSWRY